MGPLQGLKVVEIAGLGPAPFCGMVLADLGADVLRVDRAGHVPLIDPRFDLLNRGKRSVSVNLKHPHGVETVLAMCSSAEVLIEGFRPGVMERLGLGPDVCWGKNPRLIYGRVTGFGQEGPLAQAAGHDINYIALSGALHAFGRRGEAPVPPVNTVGDFGGGGMLLAVGVLSALYETQRSGKGQVVDAAMVDGAASLMTMLYGMLKMGLWRDERGVNLLDTGAHFYEVYETSDHRWIAIGSIEPQFYAELVNRVGLDPEKFENQMDPSSWSALKASLAGVFKTKTRDEWCAELEGTEVCFAPVLSLLEAPNHPHNRHRGTFIEVNGTLQPAPAPRFGRTGNELPLPPPLPGQHTVQALRDWGFSEDTIESLKAARVIASPVET